MVDGQVPKAFVQRLVGEHRRIRALLGKIDRLASVPRERGAVLDVPALRTTLEDLTRLDDEHQARESGWLFPLVGQRCPPLGPVLARMQLEHDEMERMRHELVGLLAALPRAGAASVLVRRLAQFVQLSQGHMGVEEDYIFPVAADFLSAADWQSIDAGTQAS